MEKTTKPDLVSIVVLGHMTPRIHHPYWYKHTEILVEDEFEQAMRNPVVCMEPMADLRSNSFQISCHPDRWEIRTPLADSSQRILDIAIAVFDKLSETPVSAYGFNHLYHVECAATNVARFLAEILEDSALGFESDKQASAEVKYLEHTSSCSFRSEVTASHRGPHFIRLAHNTHYAAPTSGPFDMKPLLTQGLSAAANHASSRLDGLLKSIRVRVVEEK